jgi:hypothetical protein
MGEGKEKMSNEVTIQANLEGVEQVTAGFQQIGEQAGAMGSKVGTASTGMDIGFRRLALTTAGMMMNGIQLADIMDRMAKGQMDLGRGAVMLALNFLQLASQIWLIVGAEHARAIAHAVANALSGPWGWAILAGAAAAAAIGIGLASQIPKAAGGGIITSPTILLAGERGPEVIAPLNQVIRGRGLSTVNVYINDPIFHNRGEMNYLVDRLKRMGAA